MARESLLDLEAGAEQVWRAKLERHLRAELWGPRRIRRAERDGTGVACRLRRLSYQGRRRDERMMPEEQGGGSESTPNTIPIGAPVTPGDGARTGARRTAAAARRRGAGDLRAARSCNRSRSPTSRLHKPRRSGSGGARS